jgi:hypothetical protein
MVAHRGEHVRKIRRELGKIEVTGVDEHRAVVS